MALAAVTRALERLGARPELRMAARKAGPVVSDQGNLILDAHFDSIADPLELERTLNNIPGVLDNGLFVGIADLVLIGVESDGTTAIRRMERP
jgi:ribose 5-phosphate isomerase A